MTPIIECPPFFFLIGFGNAQLVCPRFIACLECTQLETGYFKGFDELISSGWRAKSSGGKWKWSLNWNVTVYVITTKVSRVYVRGSCEAKYSRRRNVKKANSISSMEKKKRRGGGEGEEEEKKRRKKKKKKKKQKCANIFYPIFYPIFRTTRGKFIFSDRWILSFKYFIIIFWKL